MSTEKSSQIGTNTPRGHSADRQNSHPPVDSSPGRKRAISRGGGGPVGRDRRPTGDLICPFDFEWLGLSLAGTAELPGNVTVPEARLELQGICLSRSRSTVPFWLRNSADSRSPLLCETPWMKWSPVSKTVRTPSRSTNNRWLSWKKAYRIPLWLPVVDGSPSSRGHQGAAADMGAMGFIGSIGLIGFIRSMVIRCATVFRREERSEPPRVPAG